MSRPWKWWIAGHKPVARTQLINPAAAEIEVPQGLNGPLKKSKSRSLVGLKRLCHDLVSPLRGSLVVPLGARAYAHA